MRITQDFNDDWLFDSRDRVRLPHNAVELPFSYFDERTYQRPFTYDKSLTPDPAWAGREVTLRFDGAMANTTVRLNGAEIAHHADGYTPFTARLTGLLRPGVNHLSVTVDGSENPAIPPFGGVIDYLTYAGLYREVWLEIAAPIAIASVKIETPDVLTNPHLTAKIQLSNPQNLPLSGTLTAHLRDSVGTSLASKTQPASADTLTLSAPGVTLWSPHTPALYTLDLTLQTPHGTDTQTTRFGFRQIDFTPQGFHLNGQPIKLRGLNRHQAFPYIGYALGKAAQERDADILKHDLRVNMVRTSHYPQSKHFLNRCDELGLLVFEEIPGWQHIGDTDWQAASVQNVRAMIQRDWNHPSIVIWGVRINESQDNHDFYLATNKMAHDLDTTRPTGGVRFITDSELLEDVYTMNDFVLGNEELGGNRPRTPLRPQQEATGLDRSVPYMITEFGGHMYPTKSTDQEQRQAEHVTRHLDVLNAMYGDPQIAGAIGWCAFDYNTHKDFGSGDRICHHGVMDMFREPKFAAYAYASQSDPDEGAILQPVTFWARGERNIGGVLPLMILTNCDEVELRYGTHAAKRATPDRTRYPHLPHPPVILDHRHFTADELGLWGMSWENATITGYLNGQPVAHVTYACDPVASTLQVQPDATRIGPHDALRVMVRALDQAGHKLPFFPEPVSITVTGAARRIGPGFVPLRAGSTGFWIQATGTGDITITVSSDRLGTVVTQIAAEYDMSGLTLTALRKSYGAVDVIKGVDIDILPGEFTVFVGPSGCGKSTLLRMIAGLEEITGGDLMIGSRRVNEVDASQRGIAMVFQSYALYPHMTVRENMGFALKFAGIPKSEIAPRVDAAAAILGLGALMNRKPKDLSGGQRQRVAIGRAIVRQPQVFLFDEPLSNLDAELRVHMRIEIARLHRELKATIIYVTHDQVEAMTLADKIVVLREGRVEQIGSPLTLYDDPDNLFVAGFIGSPKMNFLAAKVQGNMLVLPELSGQTLPIPPLSTPLSEGADVTLGLRPDLFKRGGPASLDLTIEIVEQLGGETFALCPSGRQHPDSDIAVEDGRALRPGQNLTATFNPARALLFAPNGQRLR